MSLPSGGSSSYEESARFLEENLRQAQETSQRAQALRGQLSRLEVSLWSTGQEVKVTVGPTGLLTDIQFATRALSMSPDALSRVILVTLGRAAKELASAATEAARETVGDSNVLSQQAAAAYSEDLQKLISTAEEEDQRRR